MHTILIVTVDLSEAHPIALGIRSLLKGVHYITLASRECEVQTQQSQFDLMCCVFSSIVFLHDANQKNSFQRCTGLHWSSEIISKIFESHETCKV